jgi:hypothetical protein
MSDTPSVQPPSAEHDLPSGDAKLFSPRTVLAMILAGVFAFSALVVLSTYAPDLQSGDDGRAHALSRSAIGYGGMVRLLGSLGEPVLVTRRVQIDQAPALLVLAPDAGVDRQVYLDAVVTLSTTLLAPPKWQAGPDPRRKGWIGGLKPLPAPELDGLLTTLNLRKTAVTVDKGVAVHRLTGVPGEVMAGQVIQTGPIASLRTLSGPGLTPVLVDERGRTVLGRRGKAEAYVLSDPDLLNTMGLKDVRTARAGVEILRTLRDRGAEDQENSTIAFDVTLNGFARSKSVLKLAFEAPFVGATLCLVAAALLMGLHAAARFRAVRRGERVLALGKAALIDNSAGLIRMAGREPAMAPRYAELQRAAAIRALGGQRAGAPLEGQALDDFLDRQGQRFGAADSASSLDAETRTVRTLGDLMKVASRWHQWRLEMTRERR